MADLGDHDHPRYPIWWSDAAAGTVIFGMVVLSFLIPKKAKPKIIVNLWTTMVIGFCAAHLLFHFGYMQWAVFWKCIGLGLALYWLQLEVRQFFARA